MQNADVSRMRSGATAPLEIIPVFIREGAEITVY